MTISRVPALLALLAISGCSDPLSEACGGQRPELSECFHGAYFAECGGDRAGATIACAELGCLWFDGACIAEGYRPIECPVSDLCCHPSIVWSGRQRHWPYEYGWA